jgi:hypothetical protein
MNNLFNMPKLSEKRLRTRQSFLEDLPIEERTLLNIRGTNNRHTLKNTSG